MRLRIFLPAILLALSAGPARADLTVRYKISIQVGGGIPQAAAAELQKAMDVASGPAILVRGDKARLENKTGIVLFDYARRQISVLDPAERRFATEPMDDYLSSLSGAAAALSGPAASALRDAKISVENHATGQTATVFGIPASERLFSMNISVPMPQQSQPIEMHLEMRLWQPAAEEIARRPELAEYAAWIARARGTMDPVDMMTRLFSSIPGFADQMRGAIDPLSKLNDQLTLKAVMAVSLPGIDKMLDQLRQQGRDLPAGLALTGNLIEGTWELTELSAAPLAEDLFTVPADFRSVSMKEIQSSPSAEAAKAPSAVLPPTPTPPGELLRVGGGVTAPRLSQKVEPQYSEEARRAHLEGTVVLSIVVGTDGAAHELQVLRSIRPDLDQKAIEAVSQWKFEPGEKDGNPVNVRATVEVNFRLLHDPTQPQ
ncbi:MAG TPA: energy transducer TonB [Bryobacteraceae bacterium]|nr:energy transducer TonB [Bryobacteraceae bacterium]